jgi:ribonuclease R
MGIAAEDYDTFRSAIKRLRDTGRIVRGAKNALILPDMGPRVVGFYRANPRGFGFVIPEEPTAHGDLFIPRGAAGGAMTGDLVRAEVTRRRRRGAETILSGEIVKILQRGQNRYVGTLAQTQETWFVLPDGAKMITPIVIRDMGTAGPKAGTKVVAEIVRYAEPGDLPTGVIVETLGEPGELAVETRSVIRAHGLVEEFSPEALADARAAVDGFDPSNLDGRENLTDETIITIDPPDARDYDDALSLSANGDGTITLGVHIADVSNFVPEGSALDSDALQRGTSVYFPRRVLPMLPEILSNGVCSLQEGEPRYAKSAFLQYDADGNVLETRFAETLIRSTKRLTYVEAQGICEGKTGGVAGGVVRLLRGLEKLSRRIEARRRAAGMLHLDLPEVDLVFDEAEKLIDAEQTDDSYTHTMIEMFMVEANEAVASLLYGLERPHLRRIHPAPDTASGKQLTAFVRACGHKLPRTVSRQDLLDLLEAVRGKPESYAVNLAVLKMFQQAEYSPMKVGHFALASKHYCHFTSPIRRYPDLTVHRLLAEHCRRRLGTRPPEDIAELTKLGQDCTATEKRAESAERELRQVLLLQLMAGRVGEVFRGVITGVANFGVFVQWPQYLVEGLIRMEDLGDDWWDVTANKGQIRGERTGRTYRIGDMLNVRIAAVDVARRQMDLIPEGQEEPAPKKRKKKVKGKRKRK